MKKAIFVITLLIIMTFLSACGSNMAGEATEILTTDEQMEQDLNLLQNAQDLINQGSIEEALDVCRQIKLSNAACYLAYYDAKMQNGEFVLKSICDEINVGLTEKTDITTTEMAAVEICYGIA